MKRQQILSIAWLRAGYGGAHRYLESLAAAMSKSGFTVNIIVNRNPALSTFIERLRGGGIQVHEVLFAPNDPGATADEIDAIIRDSAPALIHFNSSAKPLRKIAGRMSSLKRQIAPICFTMHAPLFREEAAGSPGLRGRLPFSHRWRALSEKRRFLRLFDLTISVSENHARTLREALGTVMPPLIVVPNGVDTETFRPCPRSGGRGTVVIGGCGSLCEIKRFDLLIRATGEVAKAVPVELRIAGDGAEKSRLLDLVDRLGLEDVVRLVGHQPAPASFLRELDVFAITSDSEGFPYVQLEAMATGLPSVVTAVGDLPFVVRNGVDGYVTAPGDVAGIAERLLALVRSEELRARFGDAARRRIESRYRSDGCMNRTVALLHELAAGHLMNGAAVELSEVEVKV